MIGAVGAAIAFTALLTNIPITLYTQRCLFSSAFISNVHVNVFFHSSLSLYIATYLSLQATFLNVVQCAVCWKMQHRADINTRPFLNTKHTQLTFKISTPAQTRDSEISAQDTAQK